MTPSLWTDLCSPPTLTASSEKYAQLVHNSTTQLHQGVQSILSALDQRATGLTKCVNFDAALHDAKLMQQLSPSSALGYIREASIYSEQGKQRQVIDICNKGLHMADTKDSDYATLQQAKMDAEHHENTRIDFVRDLPPEIAFTTLIPMLLDDPDISVKEDNTYFHVSTIWRDYIIRSTDDLYVGPGAEEDPDGTQVIQQADHIKTLEFASDVRGTWLCDLLRNNNFSSLRQLGIGGLPADCVDDLVSSLKLLSNTLTHLQVHQENGHVVLPIGDILDNCPNLVSLDISLPFQPFPPNFSSLPTTTWPKLTTLCFSNSEEAVTCEEVIAIGKRFPSLKTLYLCPCEDPQLTRVVLDYYPWMKSVIVENDDPNYGITYMDEGPQGDDVGITDISLESNFWNRDPWRNAIPILRQHHKTLECINFDVDVPNEPEEIYNIEYDRLKNLCLLRSGWWIPRNAPMLEELKITSRTIRANPSVLDSVPPRLKRLELKLDHGSRLVDIKSPVSTYLNRFTQHSQLKELDIHFHYMVIIGNVLEAIHHLGQLESLKMTFTKKWDPCDWYHDGMERFIERLVKGCPRLSNLVINCMNAPSIHSINALKRLEHLEEFAFSITNTLHHDDFWHALETFKQLKCIRLYRSKVANMDDIRRLQGQRPDLKIVVVECSLSFEDFE
ncbi:hypothetical protein O0I10_006722 [Lichtheimia ornata]|uniref:F-box domain-containing protein n=1 Tax=Lichtheimia ornata TaxID=688661 RepID=A0AAD7V4U2_9FUNG|nr:uncharacterized protein O0I10_006722 [Lichtheimia ornata]KAJ8657656.1 hypothetical protein O0I10_006722 [Lichtheimia ornata]